MSLLFNNVNGVRSLLGHTVYRFVANYILLL